jgi:uncharacterized protein (DUF2141 family)
MPTGGAKDLVPPEMVEAVPPQLTTGFKGDRIEIRFNEYIQLVDMTRQLIISPPITPQPRVEIRKKSIWITFRDTLAANTTYNIQFGSAVADIHENTPLAGFRYVFSTGNSIDSASVSGRIMDALTATPVKDALAVLYRFDKPDSLLFRSPPDYFTRADSTGTFRISHVRPGKYRVAALQDKNNNYLSDQPGEQVAFISLDQELKDSMRVHLRLSEALPAPLAVKSSWWESPGKLLTVFSRSAPGARAKFVTSAPQDVRIFQSTYADTVIIWALPGAEEPVDLAWEYNEGFIDTVTYQRQKGTKDPTGKNPTRTNGESFPVGGGRLPPETMPHIVWPAPVVQFDTTRASVLRDSAAVSFTAFFGDSMNTNLVFFIDPVEGQYRITLLPGAVSDLYGRTNDTLQWTCTIPSDRSTGSISLNYVADTLAPSLIQLVDEKGQITGVRRVTGSLKTTFARLEPGRYRLRLVSDQNDNGRWDPGIFSERIQPEPVSYFRDQITVRSNWDVELEWND